MPAPWPGKDALPEALDFARRHPMMEPGANVFDPVLGNLFFKAGGASIIGVLAPVVGEHLFGHPVFANGPAVGLNDIFGLLAAVKSQAGNIAAVVVDKTDQTGVLTDFS